MEQDTMAMLMKGDGSKLGIDSIPAEPAKQSCL